MKGTRNDFFAPIDDILQVLNVLEKIPGALFMIKDLDSRYVYMSEALKEAIHIEPGQEVVGKTDFDLFPRIVAQNFRDNDLQVFRHGEPLEGEVHAALFFDHAPIWAISSKYPLRDRNGDIVGLITINEPYDEVAGDDDELNRLLPAIERMSKDFAQQLTVAELARECGYSERHFMRLFKDRMAVTPHRFLEQVRMFHALDSLRHSSHSVATIAETCGFHDASAFSKRFKRFTGTTPLRYRRGHREEIKRQRGLAIPRSNP